MAIRFFENKQHASIYQKYMLQTPKEVHSIILSYLENKKGRPFRLAVDVGCGTGESTRVLAVHFQKVIGVDISESQIQVAKCVSSPPNVSYLNAPAEKLPFEDESVDLITASVAAHFFNKDEFLKEVDRVLKSNGCLAMYCVKPHLDLYYKDCSQHITHAFMEAFDNLVCGPGATIIEIMKSEYEEIFKDLHFADKTRISNIVMKRAMPVSVLVGFMESIFLFQYHFSSNPEAGHEFLQTLQERILKAMGESSADTELEVCSNYFCLLACKSA
ncbi:putative methyltransferase DDB_G0268948 [Lissotriton helveticus]